MFRRIKNRNNYVVGYHTSESVVVLVDIIIAFIQQFYEQLISIEWFLWIQYLCSEKTDPKDATLFIACPLAGWLAKLQ